LATSLDDVLDFIHAAAERLTLYNITAVPKAAHQLAQIILQQTEELAKGVAHLEKNDNVLQYCVESIDWKMKPTRSHEMPLHAFLT
jgi:uncharacterized protein Yka (UPF0111/DUF47 family)